MKVNRTRVCALTDRALVLPWPALMNEPISGYQRSAEGEQEETLPGPRVGGVTGAITGTGGSQRLSCRAERAEGRDSICLPEQQQRQLGGSVS